MTGSVEAVSGLKALKRRGLAGVLLGAACLVPGAQAQENPQPPISLAPPVSLVPQNGAQDQSENTGFQDFVPEGAIAVRALDEVSSDSLGLTDAMSGGFPVDLWEQTPKELVDVLMPRLPARIASQATRSLMRNLLLSVARPPEPVQVEDVFVDMSALVPSSTGFVPDTDPVAPMASQAADDESGTDLGILERRVAQLAKMGDWSNVRSLVELVPSSAVSEAIELVATDLALVEGGVDVACADAAENLSSSTNPYWQKVFAFCQLRDGNVAGAFLTIDLLRELGMEDPAFFWAAEIMSGNRPITPNGLRRLTPLQLAMLRSAGRPFPSQLVRNGDPTLLRVLAESAPLLVVGEDDDEEIVAERMREALNQRLLAAERAVGLGALDPEVLRALYRSEVFEEDLMGDEEAEAEGTALNSDGPSFDRLAQPPEQDQDIDLNDLPVDTVLARSRLFKLAEAQIIPIARAEVISRAIDFARGDQGRRGPDVATMGLIFSPLLKSLTPSGDLDWFAGNAARALLAAGEFETGRDWLELTQMYARTSIEAAAVSAAMWPVERQFEPTVMNRFTPLRFKRWEETRSPGRLRVDKTLVLSTLTALGESVTNADWIDLMDNQSQSSTEMPAPHIWNGLTNAAGSQRLGETVLFSLLALGEDRLSSVSPIVLSQVIKSLVQVGMEAEARQLAVEAAIVQGL